MKKFVLLLTLALLSGCSMILGEDQPQIPERDDALARLEATAPCCQLLSELKYSVLEKGFDGRIFMDGSEPTFDFKTGRSFVKAFRIPDPRTGYGIVIESLLWNDQFFAPQLVVLNRDFQAVELIPPSAFTYMPAKGMDGDRLQYTLNLPPETGAAYLLLTTTTEALSGSTQYVHPARAYAKAQSLADPGVPDLYARHSPVGVVEIEIGGAYITPQAQQKDFVESWLTSFWGTDAAETIKPSVTDAEAIARSVPDSSSPVIAPAAVTTAATATVASAAPGSMMAETESMYNQMITQAVAGRDIDKAMKLVEEAERAGSASARKVFVEQVKTLK